MDACAGADVDEVVGGEHHVAVVLDDDDAVAQVAQLLEAFNETLVVALMQADAGLIEDVKDVGELRAYLRGQADALCFATAEALGAAVHREITHAHVVKERQAFQYFVEYLVRHLLVAFVELWFQVSKPCLQLQQVHVGQLTDVFVEDTEG